MSGPHIAQGVLDGCNVPPAAPQRPEPRDEEKTSRRLQWESYEGGRWVTYSQVQHYVDGAWLSIGAPVEVTL